MLSSCNSSFEFTLISADEWHDVMKQFVFNSSWNIIRLVLSVQRSALYWILIIAYLSRKFINIFANRSTVLNDVFSLKCLNWTEFLLDGIFLLNILWLPNWKFWCWMKWCFPMILHIGFRLGITEGLFWFTYIGFW